MGEFCFAIAIGKKAVMADALEPVGQDVKEKAADELSGRQCHVLNARSVPIVLPGECDLVSRDVGQTMIGDGYTVSVAAQVAQNLLGPRERTLAIDHPIEPPHRGKVGRKCASLCQMREIGEEPQTLAIVGGNKLSKKHSPEQG